MLRIEQGNASEPLVTTAHLIAEIFIRNAKDGMPTMDAEIEAHFTPDQIKLYGAAAKRLAHEAMNRDIREDVVDLPYDRVARVQNGAALIGGLQPSPQAIFDCLAHNGYPSREIGKLWPEILAIAGDKFADLQRVS